jgi:hypothetical protein
LSGLLHKLIHIFKSEHRENGTEDLFLGNSHGGIRTIENGGLYEITAVSGPPPGQNRLGSFIFADLHILQHAVHLSF